MVRLVRVSMTRVLTQLDQVRPSAGITLEGPDFMHVLNEYAMYISCRSSCA